MSRAQNALLVGLALALLAGAPVRADAAGPSTGAATAPADLPEAGPDPMIAACLAVGAPLGVYALSLATPYRELMFLAPATYGAGHFYARDPWRALSVSAGGYGAAVAGLGLAVGVVSLFPGTAGESLSRVLWGGAVGAVGFGPFAAWDAMRTAQRSEPRP